MSENNKTRFGNMPLGMINKMLVSFIGEDAFLDYCEKYHKDWKLDWQSREAFRKHLDRLFEEKESSYRDLNPHYEQSVYRIAWKILDDFCKEYGLSRYIADTILDFYDLPTLQLSKTEYPICETHYMLDIVICGILPIFVKKTVAEIDTNNEISFSYLDAETKYNMVFDELGKKFKDKNGEKSSLEKFYRELDTYAGKIDHFKKIIINNCKKGQNPAKWKDMKTILDFCKEKGKDLEVAHLIEAYLTANVKNFIKAEIPESDWKKIKSCFESIGKNVFNKFIAEKKKSGDTTYLKEKCLYLTITPLGLLHQMLLESMGDKSEPINLALLEILEKYVYLKDEKRAEDLISNIEKVAPEASSFYCNWLHAYIAVAKGEFKMAKELYSEAFRNIHFAGICTEDFLKQAFVLSVYCDSNPDAVRNSIDPEKPSQTPLPQSGKRFWEYGHAIGVFDKPAEEAYLEYVYQTDNFFAEFPREMFFPGKEINIDRIKPAPIGSFAVFIENIKKQIEEEYTRLSALKEGSINKCLGVFNKDDYLRLPPLSMAIWLFIVSSDDKFLNLIERWLGVYDPKTAMKNLNFNTISYLGKTPFNATETAVPHFILPWFSDLGETPLNAATMAYKDSCANNSDPESPVKKRLKGITTCIFDKTDKDYRGIATKRQGIHPLQNVIDSCDIDLVKKFVEGGLDIDKSRLDPDKVSPVYYTIERIIKLQDPQAHANPGNTKWKFLDAPGINAEDRKKNYYDKMNKSSFTMQEMKECVRKVELCDESTYMEQIKKLKEICLWLIDYTKNQDEYKFSNNLGTEWTTLTLAAETDDVDICRALLDHGANPNISLKTGGDKIPNTFLHRCIEHEAWNILEMFLTDFKDKASETIKKYNNSEYEPLAFFKAKNKGKREEFMEKFIKLFESCSVDLTINSPDEKKVLTS